MRESNHFGFAQSPHDWCENDSRSVRMEMIDHYIILVDHFAVHFQSMAFRWQFSGVPSLPYVDAAVLGRIGHWG